MSDLIIQLNFLFAHHFLFVVFCHYGPPPLLHDQTVLDLQHGDTPTNGSQSGMSRSKTIQNTSRGMPSPSGPPPIPKRNSNMLRKLRRSLTPTSVWPPATDISIIHGKGSPRATRPCRQEGNIPALLLAATTRRQALTRSQVFLASARLCSRRVIGT